MSRPANKDDGNILIGTASWTDPGFVERWYPQKMAAHERLAWYAQHFAMVEINSTFYSTQRKLLPPELQRIAQIDAKEKVNTSPELKDALLESFLRPMSILQSAGKLGVFLLQLSPAFSPRKHHLSELEPLIERLADYQLAIEFRNRNWVVGDQLKSTIVFLRKRNVGFVNVDAPASDHFSVVPSDLNEITNPTFSYLRLHGRDPKAYLT